MNYLLDTCVLSEVIKPEPVPTVLNWLREQDEADLYISVLTLGEIEKGIEKSVDERRRNRLRIWVEEDLKERFEGRILPVDQRVAIEWGRVQARAESSGRPMPAIDGLIAVTGLVNNCIVVSRNVSDMQASSVELFNPWNSE